MSVTNPGDAPSLATDANDKENEFRRNVYAELLALRTALDNQGVVLRRIHSILEGVHERGIEAAKRRTGEKL